MRGPAEVAVLLRWRMLRWRLAAAEISLHLGQDAVPASIMGPKAAVAVPKHAALALCTCLPPSAPCCRPARSCVCGSGAKQLWQAALGSGARWVWGGWRLSRRAAGRCSSADRGAQLPSYHSCNLPPINKPHPTHVLYFCCCCRGVCRPPSHEAEAAAAGSAAARVTVT